MPRHDDIPQTQCPACGTWQDDLNGFGVLRCETCGHCAHPSLTDGVCDVCGQTVVFDEAPELAEEAHPIGQPQDLAALAGPPRPGGELVEPGAELVETCALFYRDVRGDVHELPQRHPRPIADRWLAILASVSHAPEAWIEPLENGKPAANGE